MRLTSVSGTLETIIKKRPVLECTSGLGGTGGSELGDVTVDDVALFTGRYDSGVLGIFEATRFATGRKNALRVEVSGTKGAIAFDLEDLNTLQFYDATAAAGTQGFTRILVTEPEHPYVANWWPTGHMLGYEHGFVAPGQGLRRGDQRRRPSRPRRSPTACRCSASSRPIEASSGAGSAWTDV